MEIINVNYQGYYEAKLDFSNLPSPQMIVLPLSDGSKLLMFKSGKCRMMGSRTNIVPSIPDYVTITKIQSITAMFHLGHTLVLSKFAHLGMYEPELFPALRLKAFNPMCVNVFGTGKVIVMGIKKFEDMNSLMNKIVSLLTI